MMLRSNGSSLQSKAQSPLRSAGALQKIRKPRREGKGFLFIRLVAFCYLVNSIVRSFSQKSNFAASDTSPSLQVALNHHSQAPLSVDLSQTISSVAPAAMPSPMSKTPHFLPSSDTWIFLMASLVLLWNLNLYSVCGLAKLSVKLSSSRAAATMTTFPKLLLTRIDLLSPCS